MNTAVSPLSGSMTYLMNRRYPACNRILSEAPATAGSDETLIAVPTRPLGRIMDELLLKTRIDLLSIDCEGSDLDILRDYDFSRRRPGVIAAEDSAVRTDSALSDFLQTKDYECKAHIGLTKIFQSRGD